MSNTHSLSLNSEANLKASWWWLIILLYGLSGFTSLAYEVLWSHMLSMQFGVSIFGVVLTVSAFMFGLGVGSLAGVRWAKHCRKPLLLFAILEIGIAAYALSLPTLLHFVSAWMAVVSSHLTLSQWYLLQGAEALCLLLIPAVAMGVGFALVLKVADKTPLSLGRLYGLNTLGGAIGALFPLWGLPVLGWGDSIKFVALLGFLVGFLALYTSKFTNSERKVSAPDNNESLSRPPLPALLIYAGIGAGSIMLEVGWIRLYGMVMLRTEYVLGVILAVFLLGIALGSLLVPRVSKYSLSVLMPFVVGFGVLLSLWLLPVASSWVENSQYQSFFGAIWSQALMVALFTLPVTLALGAWLPLLASHYEHVEFSGVWLYGANCLGGGIGAIVACLILIPVFGSVAMVVLSGMFIAALGLVLIKSRWVWLCYAVMLAFAWPLRSMPPVHDLLPMIEANSQDVYLFEDAISLTHVVEHSNGQRVLLSDLQRMDASTEPSAVEIQKDQARLALLLHPEPHSVLFLGLGTGISMAGSSPLPNLKRCAVELSKGAIFASRHWFSEVNDHIVDQAIVHRDDARHYLNTTDSRYDVIIGDLFHPDLAGMGSLLSVQQFQRVRKHLSTNGVFVQWIALNQFDTLSLGVVLRSFKQVFPYAQLFMDGMHLALVGPRQAISVARVMQQSLQRLNVRQQSGITGGEGLWTWLGRYWGPIPDSLGPIQDEWVPFIEYNLPRARYDGRVNLVRLMSWLLKRHPDPAAAMKILGIAENNKRQFGRAYVATELSVRSWIAAIQGKEAKSVKLVWLAYQANPEDHWIANALADSMMQSLSQATGQGIARHEALMRVLKVAPNHVDTLRALWHMARAVGNKKESAYYRSRLLAISPLDRDAKSGAVSL